MDLFLSKVGDAIIDYIIFLFFFLSAKNQQFFGESPKSINVAIFFAEVKKTQDGGNDAENDESLRLNAGEYISYYFC